MNKENASKTISLIDEKYINEATEFAINAGGSKKKQCLPEQSGRHALRKRWAVAAACLAVVIIAGSTMFAFATEAAEYRTAVAFFDQYGLSAEGLSRAEIKAVYRDITTKSFKNGKTVEVIRQAVPGWEIQQAEPTAEEIAAVWDRSIFNSRYYLEGYAYAFPSYGKHDDQRDIEVFDKSVVKCSKDDTLLWTAEVRDFYVTGAVRLANCSALWGQSETYSASDIHYGWVACMDDAGKLLWEERLDHGFRYELVVAVLDSADGGVAVVSRGDWNYLCLSRYDASGRELGFQKTEMGDLYIRNAVSLRDGYLVHLINNRNHVSALLCRMDLEGNVLGTYSLESDDSDYYITGMAEYNKQVFLSGYAVPKQSDEGGMHEIANVLDHIMKKDNWEISSEELTALLRDNYTAVLLLCDPDRSVPRTFYSVKGSLGGKLKVNDSYKLEWDVESITSSRFSPATSAYSIRGNCKVFRYTFDSRGKLAGQTDTGNTATYSR